MMRLKIILDPFCKKVRPNAPSFVVVGKTKRDAVSHDPADFIRGTLISFLSVPTRAWSFIICSSVLHH